MDFSSLGVALRAAGAKHKIEKAAPAEVWAHMPPTSTLAQPETTSTAITTTTSTALLNSSSAAPAAPRSDLVAPMRPGYGTHGKVRKQADGPWARRLMTEEAELDTHGYETARRAHEKRLERCFTHAHGGAGALTSPGSPLPRTRISLPRARKGKYCPSKAS